MKTSMAIITLALLSSQAFAQTVDKDLGGNGDWKAQQISGHNLWKKSACVAFVKSSDAGSFLELYAEQEGDIKGSFVEPTIDVVTKESGYVRAVLSDANGAENYQLTLASTREATPAFGLVARFGDRTKILNLLKQASSAKVVLMNSKGKPTKTLVFSLKGSTKTIDTAVSGCGLML